MSGYYFKLDVYTFKTESNSCSSELVRHLVTRPGFEPGGWGHVEPAEVLIRVGGQAGTERGSPEAGGPPAFCGPHLGGRGGPGHGQRGQGRHRGEGAQVLGDGAQRAARSGALRRGVCKVWPRNWHFANFSISKI